MKLLHNILEVVKLIFGNKYRLYYLLHAITSYIEILMILNINCIFTVKFATKTLFSIFLTTKI